MALKDYDDRTMDPQDDLDARTWEDEEQDETTPHMIVQPPPTVTVEEAATTHKVPAQYIELVYGRPFVIYEGLLAMAQEQGLIELAAEFISVTPELALAKAHAFFQDGRKFWEAADATPENVNKGVRTHFARCSLTRAKARCLRDALNIGICALEEVDASPDRTSPPPVAPPPQEPGEGWCPKHHMQMTYYPDKKNEGEGWYSHKLADGKWCKGR